jgi:pimeloyl-ACP methyl ester carboxylesterase
VACSSSSGSSTPTTDAGGDSTVGDDGGGGYQVEISCADALSAIYADPGMLPTEKGAIIHCAKDKDIAKADLEAAARTADLGPDGGVDTPGYAGKPFTSGAHVYKILYRTERGDDANTAGYASATVYVPDAPRAAQSPLVVASHGSRGQCASAAASKLDKCTDTNGDYIRQVYPLVGAGYVVIASDLAGYANYGGTNNAPSAYGDVADVGKSTLDGARALKKMLGKSLLDKVVLVGHSQGGGTALGAFALSPTYAPELTIAAVSVYSPLWLSARANGAFLLKPGTYTLQTSAVPSVILWYMYTHGELLDGPGHGVDVFAANKRAIVKSFIDNDCWNASYPDLEDAGASANDFLDPAFIAAIKYPAAGLGGCMATDDPAACCANSNSPDVALCTKWMKRFVSDWPHITGAATSVPILSMYGGHDETITPDVAACVFTRYKADGLNYKVCFDPAGGHSSIVSVRADYVNDWIAARTLGAPEPSACPNDENALKDDAGTPIPCNALLPPN